MAVEYVENIVQLVANLAALLMCLFYYISSKHRGWLYAIAFFLSSLLSCYYWTSYLVIMGDWPNVSDLMTYFGWNVSYLLLFLLLMYMKTPEERRYFHLLMLLPIPLNAWQFTLYLPYGRLFNNIYQVAVCTQMAVFSIQGFCWYYAGRKKNRPDLRKPYLSLAVFLFALFEFAMWTFSCLDEPFASLYYPASILCSLNYFSLVWAVRRTYTDGKSAPRISFDKKYQNILKAVSLGIILVFSFGGILLGLWIRNTITRYLGLAASDADIYGIIPIVLFIISLILIAFVAAVIFVVYFAQNAAENNQLREARKIAERSNAAKSEFLANMSHEIRTPINAVMGMNEIILRESRQARDRLPEDSESVRKIFNDICGYSGTIGSAGKNLLSIINDILDISRIEAGKLEIREEPYSLSSVLKEVCSLIRFRASSKNLAFEVNVEEHLPDRLNGDALRVRQIMLNLLSNAVKYTNRGSVTLSVYVGEPSVSGPGDVLNLAFSVRDTGIGIRPEDRDRLFDKFERIGLEKYANVEGTGLGLAITRTLLDMMGGTVRVDSVYGKGSVFTVTVPQKIVSREPIGVFRETSANSEKDRKVTQDLFRAPDARILVVDDTRMNLTVVEGLLKGTEVRIDKAESGEDALQHTLSIPYDLILMDQRMPGMDGTEALSRVRAQENGANRKTPVICLTADAISGAKEKYLDSGFSDYISKPIDSRLLRKKLIAFLPPEKVILLPDGEADAPESRSTPPTASGDAFTGLREEGIDVAQGLGYCMQDEGLYRSLLSEFTSGAAEKADRMERCFASGDWENYRILVHSLKSVSATIGASRLSEAAAAAEAAAASNDVPELRRGHSSLCSLYLRTADAVRPFGASPDSAQPEDGIMEFMPE